MNNKIIKDAFYKSLPILVGYVVIGFGFGIILRNAGYGAIWAFAMSLLIYAGSMQYVGVSLLMGPASIISTILTTFMVNARHLFYSISMLSKYQGAKKFKPYLIFALTDETYALLSTEDYADKDNLYKFNFLVSLFNHSYWLIGSVLGSLFAKSVSFNTAGIEFSMTALFIAAFYEQWIVEKNRMPALIGLIITLISRIIFNSKIFLIPAMLAITFVLILLEDKLVKFNE